MKERETIIEILTYQKKIEKDRRKIKLKKNKNRNYLPVKVKVIVRTLHFHLKYIYIYIKLVWQVDEFIFFQIPKILP